MRMNRVSALLLLSCVAASAQSKPAAHSVKPSGTRQEEAGHPATQTRQNSVDVRSGAAVVRLTALGDNTIRVQMSADGKFPVDNSWAVLPEAVAAMKPSAAVQVSSAGGGTEMATKSVRVRVSKPGLAVTFMDAAGNVISQDDAARPVSFRKVPIYNQAIKSSFQSPELVKGKMATSFKVWKVMPEDEHYFGLGDKAGPLDHRAQAFTMWNTDAFGWQESTDPLYKTIPFFVALRKGVSYGIFLDNTFRTHWDFGKAERDAFSFGSDDGPLDYYFFYGPSPKKVIEQYTGLTGRTPMPAIWTLGYQQCRYSYFPEARVREIAKTFRDKNIPVDAIYLDIDYQRENRPFTVDPQKFPNFTGMIADLAKQGIKTILITDMHIKKEDGYAPYDSGMRGDHFVKNPDGSVFVGPVWPGPSVFPDFTRGKVTREWWGSLYKEFVKDGVKGFWNDMNEPAVFERVGKTMPLDAVHRVAMPDGSERKADHREIHNVYGFQNVRATYEGQLELSPNQRPFVLTRAAYAGAQRYAATWTGDNSSSWNHMRLSLPMLMNMGVSGYANVGVDIGGYWGSPLPEVLTRWTEIGAFNPVYRNHTQKGTADQEPWVHGPEQEAIRKKYIELRYRLMPYTYSAFEENTRNGDPVMRPLFLEFPDGNDAVVTSSTEFMFGKDILVAPKVWEFMDTVEVTLPHGEWFDYWSGERVKGDQVLQVKDQLDRLPIYVRAGAFLPQMPVVQSMDEMPNGPLELRIYPPTAEAKSNPCGGLLYTDDGLTYNFRKGEHWHVSFRCTPSTDSLVINTEIHGSKTYKPWWKAVQVQVYGAEKAASKVEAGNSELKSSYDAAGKVLSFTLPVESMQQEIRVKY